MAATVTVQGSLFAAGSGPGLCPLDAVERVALDDGAWIERLPGWMAGADGLFDHLLGSVPWETEQRLMYGRPVDVPRLHCFYDRDRELPSPALALARERLSHRYGGGPTGPMTTVGLCLYRDGSDSVAWHGDTIGRGRTEDTVVAIVSLGATRTLHLRPVGGGPSTRLRLDHGDLMVMGGSCQRTWEHAVPKTRRAVGPRISAQFRAAGVR